MNDQQSLKPKYIGDLEDARETLIRQVDLIDDIYKYGYDETYQRHGGKRKRTDQFLRQFQTASRTELNWAREEITKKRIKLNTRIEALKKNSRPVIASLNTRNQC